MPVIPALLIAAGAIEVSAVVAGLVYASAGLYVVGKATGNNTLLKLSAVAGLAAGGVGLVEGLSAGAGALTGAEGGAEAGAAEFAGAGADAATGVEGAAAADGATGATTYSVPDPSAGVQTINGAGAGTGATGAVDASTLPTGIGAAPDATNAFGVTPPTAQTTTAGLTDTGALQAQTPPSTATTANNLTGNTQAATAQPSSLINPTQAAPAEPLTQSGIINGNAAGTDHLPSGDLFSGATEDKGMLGNAKAWFDKQTPSDKLAISNFVAKGLGAITDFIGPKAELMKAQAGMYGANTALTQQQVANMKQPIPTVQKMNYTKG